MGGLKKDRLVEVTKEQLPGNLRRWGALLVGYRNPGRVTHSYGGEILGLTRIGIINWMQFCCSKTSF